MLFLLGALPLLFAGQSNVGASQSGRNETIAVSIETGRYEPEPGCEKHAEGCLPKGWTATTEFSLGSHVWLRATFINHSTLTAYEFRRPEFPGFSFDVLDAQSARPHLTKEGCRQYPSLCTQSKDEASPGVTILGGGGVPVTIAPGGTTSLIEEISKPFMLSNSGTYTVSFTGAGFVLTPKNNIDFLGNLKNQNDIVTPEISMPAPIHFTVQ